MLFSENAKNPLSNLPEGATVINAADVPLTENGEPDIAAILAANGLGHIDLSKVTIVKPEV
jgi:hypothetical protein